MPNRVATNIMFIDLTLGSCVVTRRINWGAVRSAEKLGVGSRGQADKDYGWRYEGRLRYTLIHRDHLRRRQGWATPAPQTETVHWGGGGLLEKTRALAAGLGPSLTRFGAADKGRQGCSAWQLAGMGITRACRRCSSE